MPTTVRDIDWTLSHVEWNTPRWVIDMVEEVFGRRVDLDPCSNKRSVVWARTNFIRPRQDGLRDSWMGYPTIYCNPPYGRGIGQWMKRCAVAQIHGSQVIAFVPAYVETRWWQETIIPTCKVISVPKGRIACQGKWHDEQPSDYPPMATCLPYWGKDPSRFIEVFSRIGQIVIPYRNGVRK